MNTIMKCVACNMLLLSVSLAVAQTQTEGKVVHLNLNNMTTTVSHLLPQEGDSVKVKAAYIDTSKSKALVREQVSARYPTGKGSSFISGLGSFSVASQSGNTLTTITLAPNAIFFVAKGFGLGFDMSLSYLSADNSSITQIAIGPKLVGAFGSAQSTVYPYLGFGVDYLSASTSGGSASNTGSLIKGGLGIMVKIGEHLGLPVELGITVQNTESSKEALVTYSLGIGLAGLLY